jgi:23S rRNA (uracil1939-C5)-methyltransferase
VEQDSGSKECFLEDPSNSIRLAVKEYAEENNLEFLM